MRLNVAVAHGHFNSFDCNSINGYMIRATHNAQVQQEAAGCVGIY